MSDSQLNITNKRNQEKKISIEYIHRWSRTSLVAQTVMWESRVHSLGTEDPLEKGIATHSSILAWRIP